MKGHPHERIIKTVSMNTPIVLVANKPIYDNCHENQKGQEVHPDG
jgi:hypothetical protein